MNIFGEIGALFNVIFMQPIFNVLIILYYLFKDYGLAIVVLTVIIKLLLFPLTLKQLKSMKANQQLQPQMQEIRKKYAKDPQAQTQALQALYREYNVNPLSGCLPMLVQLPVLYGLYYALYHLLQQPTAYKDWLYPFIQPLFTSPPDVNFYWVSWINPDWVFSLAHTDPTHILPIVAALATFVQIRMSQPKTAPKPASDKAAGPDPTASTMKIMQFIMPGMTLIFAWTFPAGLALYWTVSSIFQAVQQYFVTGWGALLTTPNLTPKSGGTGDTKSTVVEGTAKVLGSNGSGKKRTSDGEDDEGEDDAQPAGSRGAIASKMRTGSSPRPGNGSSSQRPRGGSASARRRGGAQRSRR